MKEQQLLKLYQQIKTKYDISPSESHSNIQSSILPESVLWRQVFYLSSETKILTLSYNSKLYKVPKGKFQGYKNKLNKSNN